MADHLARTAAYYNRQSRAHGSTPRGADWNSAGAQLIRFRQLLKVLGQDRSGSVLDYGCGYGALLRFLRDHGFTGRYQGYDIADEQIRRAQARNAADRRCAFTDNRRKLKPADYVIASGIFNVKGKADRESWRKHVARVINDLDRLARKGFAFNLITSYVDYRQPPLYYAKPEEYFALCKRKYAKNVALLHDYDLYDFTVLVRKSQ